LRKSHNGCANRLAKKEKKKEKEKEKDKKRDPLWVVRLLSTQSRESLAES
jgi:hypothetical protein